MLGSCRRGKIISLLVLVAVLSLLTYGITGTDTCLGASQEGSHGTAHESPSTEGEHGGGGHGGDRSADLRDLLYRFINFALLVIILVIAIKKSGLKENLSGRIDEIKQKLEDLQTGKSEAESRYLEIEKKLKDFEAEKKEILEQFRQEGLAEKERIISEARAKAVQIIEQAELNIENEMASAKDRLKQEVMNLAAQKAEEILTKELNDNDQDRLVDEFIERVGKIH
jgi:F-type H+-transporting ATPase subunit b